MKEYTRMTYAYITNLLINTQGSKQREALHSLHNTGYKNMDCVIIPTQPEQQSGKTQIIKDPTRYDLRATSRKWFMK